MDIVARLKKYMEHLGISSTQFADIASIPRPTLSQILSGRNKKISNELLTKIHAAYPDLSINWLLFGDNDMIDAAAPAPLLNIAKAPETAPELAPSHDANLGNLFAAAQMPIPEIDHSETTKKLQQVSSIVADKNKKIQNIIVFYTDSSFEIYSPAQ